MTYTYKQDFKPDFKLVDLYLLFSSIEEMFRCGRGMANPGPLIWSLAGISLVLWEQYQTEVWWRGDFSTSQSNIL